MALSNKKAHQKTKNNKYKKFTKNQKNVPLFIEYKYKTIDL